MSTPVTVTPAACSGPAVITSAGPEMGVIIAPTPEQAVPVWQLIPSATAQVGLIRRRPALLTVTQRDMPTYCNWLEQFQIAEYSRLTLGLPRHGTCEQVPQFCAAA
jgi:hypothetical protein